MKFKKACEKLTKGEKLTCKAWPVPVEFIYLRGAHICDKSGRDAESLLWGYHNKDWKIYEEKSNNRIGF